MSIIADETRQVNDIYAGIPCHDAGMSYPGWCIGCREEADSRDLIACRHEAAHAACFEPATFTDRELSRMALENAFDDFDGERGWA